MTFTRTNQGLANYTHFFNSEIIVYTEGRCLTESPIDDEKSYDSKYYESIVKAFTEYKKIKIKLVGSKSNALDYHEKIVGNSIKNSIVFVDRDYDDLIYSRFTKPKLLTTYGYSWENDFWSLSLCANTLLSITVNDATAEAAFISKYKRTIARLGKLSCLNAAAHIDGRSIFPSTGSSKGISLIPGNFFPIKKSEFSRLVRKLPYKKDTICDCMASTIFNARSMPVEKIIQGHLLEFAMLLLLSSEYKNSTSQTTANQVMIKNIAFSYFAASPTKYLTESALEHYINEFQKI